MKTKKLFLTTYIATFIFALITFNSLAQAPAWAWAKSVGGTGDDQGNSIATDASGNVFITGFFSSSSITFGTTTLTRVGNSANIFIVKYNGAGNALWAKSAGVSVGCQSKSVFTDANGNVYMTGFFDSPYINFGTDTLWNSSGGYYASDIFIVKYDGAGNVRWAKSAGGTNQIADDWATSVSTDVHGNVYMTGWFASAFISVDTTTLNNIGPASRDVFVVKYDSLGTMRWAKSGGGNGDVQGNSVSSDTSGNVYITGTYRGTSVIFGTTVLTKTDSTQNNIFIVKYNKFGNLVWAKSVGGFGDDGGNGVSTDVNGNVYVTGYFTGNSTTFGTTTLTPSGSSDIFLVKYNSSGTVLWAKSEGAPNPDISTSVYADANGNVIMAGYFYSPSITFGTTTLTKAIGNYPEIFIVKYDGSGSILWAKSSSATNQCAGTFAYSVSSDVNGNIYVTGYFGCPTVNFGTTVLTNTGVNDIFIAKLGTTTGFENTENNVGINLYPNPNNGKFIINNNGNNIKEVEIYNLLGESIYQSLVNNQSSQIDLSAQPKGIYFVKIIEREKIYSQKIIIQ